MPMARMRSSLLVVDRRLVELQVVAVGVVEGGDAAPRMVGDAVRKLDARGLELLDGVLDAVAGLEREHAAARAALGLARVEADPQVVDLQLGPLVLLLGHVEAERAGVEVDGTTDVGDGEPHDRNAMNHGGGLPRWRAPATGARRNGIRHRCTM